MLLHIIADDFGYCPKRNQAIVNLFQAGAISGASLLINARYARDAVQQARMAGLPFGLHFNITEGLPVSETTDIESLVTASGCFRGKMAFRSALSEGTISKNHIKIELQAQIRRFEEISGIHLSRVDGHQHVHVLPGVCESFAQTLKDNSIICTRVPFEPTLNLCSWMDEETKAFRTRVSHQAQESSNIFKSYGMLFAEAFYGMSVMGFDMTLDKVSATFPNVGYENCEWMVHPGFPCTDMTGGCGTGPDDFSQDAARQWEYNFLTSTNLKHFFLQNGIQIA